MKTYLRIGADYLEDAVRYPSKSAACAAFLEVALELDRFGQSIEGALHYANSKAELVEYPDFVLSLGTRGGLKIERT